jgi:hypothetical protein
MATLYTRKRYALAPFLGNGPYAAHVLVTPRLYALYAYKG